MDEGVVNLEGVIPTAEAYRPVFVVYNIVVFGVVILVDGERKSMGPEGFVESLLVSYEEERASSTIQEQHCEVYLEGVRCLENSLRRSELFTDPG